MERSSLTLVALTVLAAASLAAAHGRSAAGGWQVRDLGTLGGPGSVAVAANEHGQVIGTADTAEKAGTYGYEHRAFLWQDGHMIDLGTLGGPESEAVAINDAGQVVGNSDTARKLKYGYAQHAFLWQAGKMIDLGTLGGVGSEAVGINGKGWVAGTADRVQGKHAFLWRDGKMRDLGTLGGLNSEATAISYRGTVVGTSDTKHGSSGFKWQLGTMHPLPYSPLLTPGGRISGLFKPSPPGVGYHGGVALALNEQGNTAGYCIRFLHNDAPAQPCAWLHGKAVALGLLRHGNRGRALDLNNSDQIVGRAGIGPPSGKNHAFVWQHGRMIDLGGLRPNDWSVAQDITDNGLLVGYSMRTTQTPPHAAVWTPTR